ncbi:hypothetical protein FRC07_011309 [Ceratobasidium sp. 392]|nr:hypothetical protein FRC07_011309 [Ceratobasidium sp. 392]
MAENTQQQPNDTIESGQSSISPEPPQTAGEADATTQLQFRLWNPPPAGTVPPPPLPSDLEPTAAEVAAAYQSQSKRVERLQNVPLVTQQMRDRQQADRLRKWPNCIIRVRFHNQMQLEKSFPSTSKIKAVYAFVRDCLDDETKPIKFILYQPPARELKVSDITVRDKTLLELQLAPASVLLLRFLSDELNARDKLPPLQQSILAVAEDLPLISASGDEPVGPSEVVKPRSSKGDVEQKLAKFLKLPARK